MGSVDKLMDLSKYILTLPSSKTSVFMTLVASFIVGIIFSFTQPSNELFIYNMLNFGVITFFMLGLTTLSSGALTQPLVNSLDGRHMKVKQSLFLSFFSMCLTSIIFLGGSILFAILHINAFLNLLILSVIVGFSFNALVLWSTSNIRFLAAVIIGAIQPVLILSMFVLIASIINFTVGLGPENIVAMFLKAIIGSLVLVIAVYSFVTVIESPARSNLGVGGLELLSLFIAHMTEGSFAMETLFENMGEEVNTLVGITSFKNKNGIKANFVSPCVHPGPVGEIGGGNLPTILSNQAEYFTIVAHGAATHDFNPVASKEIKKITDRINETLPNMNYESSASKFTRNISGDAKVGIQHFNNGMILLSTFSPVPADDIEFGVGLALMYAARTHTNADNVSIVDCHNCLYGDTGRILAGHKEIFELEDAISSIEENPKRYPLKMGYAYDPMDEIKKEQGIGPSGTKIMIIEVDNQKTAYVVIDGNNMQQGFRETIIDNINKNYPEIDMIEVMTTDTHTVNTIAGGHNPVGLVIQDEIIDTIIKLIPIALNDLEEVSVASESIRVKLNTLGPNHSTELVTTISSIISVSKILAPLIFIVAIITLILWIF
ncbi:MAG: DUF2070 family protein [Methanobacteriaceae archaeon]|nr:DUF2070 family protein [Methanobacteriaceae archaeon]